MGQVGGSIICLMIVIGVVGNILVLTAIVQSPQLRRSYNAFIASLSVTDLVFNVTVMPFYVDTYIHRRWRFSDAVCRWHTFFGAIVVVSSSLHIALIATSRYHVIVHPNFYARWLSSGVAVVSQIVFVWIIAVAIVLPGIVGVLPTVIGYSDQVSRCSYDRVDSYGALSFLFCAGFIVPCVVMCFCYGMIWRRTMEVGLRVDGYSAFKLLKIHQNGKPVFTSNCPPSVTAIPSVPAAINTEEIKKTEPLLSADDKQHPANGDNIIDVCRLTSEQPSDKNTHADSVTEYPQGTAENCQDRLLSVVDEETISATIDEPHAGDLELNDVQLTTERQITANCSNNTFCNSANDEDDVDNNEQKNEVPSRRRINFDDHHQLTTAPFSTSNSAFDSNHVAKYTYKEISKKLEHLEHLPTETQTPNDERIKVVITPPTTSGCAVTASRESSTGVVASDATDKIRDTEEHLDFSTRSDDSCLAAAQHIHNTRHSAGMSPFRRRLQSLEVDKRSPVRLPSPTSHRHRTHSLHMILVVFFAFVLTYLPFTLTNLADQQGRLDRNIYMVTSLAFWAGSSINPLIYGIMNVQFRRAYVSIVMNCWRHSIAH